jgi:hypothetical protein
MQLYAARTEQVHAGKDARFPWRQPKSAKQRFDISVLLSVIGISSQRADPAA